MHINKGYLLLKKKKIPRKTHYLNITKTEAKKTNNKLYE